MCTHSQLIGKYVYVDNVNYDPRDGYYGDIVLCQSLDDVFYTCLTKYGKTHITTIDHIQKIIDITVKQKFQLGDIVLAVVDCVGPCNEPVNDYCKVIGVKIFCNEIDYDLVVIKTNKNIRAHQSNIRHTVTMPIAKYTSGMRVGVKVMKGCQYDYWEEVNNAIITNVNAWYNGVKYIVKFDSGEISTVEEINITTPVVVKTPEQVKKEDHDFLLQREQQLLADLEMTRRALQRY